MVLQSFFFGGALLAIGIVLLCAYGYFIHYKKKTLTKTTTWFSLIAVIYAFFAYFHLSWFTDSLVYSSFDYLIIYTVGISVQTILFFIAFYSLENKRSLLYWLAGYAVAFLGFFISTTAVLLSLQLISHFFLLSLLTRFMIASYHYRRLGYAGIVYALISLVTTFLLFLRVGELYYYGLLAMVGLGVFVYLFYKDLASLPIQVAFEPTKKETPAIALFVRYFIYLIVMVYLILFGTVGVHELSHVIAARHYGCESRAILYEESSYPYSEIICSTTANQGQIALAGPLVPLLIAFVLFIVGGPLIRPVSFVIIGFNLLASSRDVIDMGFSQTIANATTIGGLIVLIVGIGLLIKARFSRDHVALENN